MLVAPADRLARRQRVAAACRRLSLSPPAGTLGEPARPSPEAVLMTVLEAARAHRETPRRPRLLNQAGFPPSRPWTATTGRASRSPPPSPGPTGRPAPTSRPPGIWGSTAPSDPVNATGRPPWGSVPGNTETRSAAAR
jgi:hypothetical protein